MGQVFVTAFGVLLALGAYLLRRDRARVLRHLRATWGHSVVRVRRLDAIRRSHRSRLHHGGFAASLDDRTWDDLNLDEVFAGIDRTNSTLGQHALYHRLRTPHTASDLEAFEALVSRFSADIACRERAQAALVKLQDPQGYDLWWLATHDAVETPSWYLAFPALTAVTLLLVVLAFTWHHLFPAVMLLIGVNVTVRWLINDHIAATTMALRQLPSVIAAGRSLEFLEPGLGSRRSGPGSLWRLKTIARWITGDPFLLPMHAGSFAWLLNDVVNTAFEYVNGALLLDASGVHACSRDLRRHGAELVRLAASVGDADAALSVASLRAGRTDWTIPVFRSPGAATMMASITHPLVSDAVPNTITLDSGAGVIVTGSNMSGKSTFLRTVGVTTVMAQSLNTCFAAAYQAPVLRVRSCIGRTDDLIAGKSYYIVEVESLLGLVDSSSRDDPHMYLLDELFRGTNAVERIAAGEAVLRELITRGHERKPHVVLAATHDGELVDFLRPLYDPYHFGDALNEDGLVFDHRLRPGRATTRNAIAILRLHRAPETLVTAALRRAADLDQERGTASVDR